MERNIVKDYSKSCLKLVVKCFVAIMFCIIILSPAWLLDATYHKWLDFFWLNKLLAIVTYIGHMVHFSYGRGQDFLQNGFGVLITSISLMITMGTNSAIRSENRVFGISRLIWQPEKNKNIYRNSTKVVFCFPMFMLIAIHWGFCITGYLIFIFSCLYVTYSYLRLNESFNMKKDYQMIITKLFNITQENYNNQTLKIYLESMRGEIEIKRSWANVEELFHQMVDEINNFSSERSFILIYYFYDCIYLQDNIQWQKGVETLKDRISIINETNDDEEKEFIVIWAILTSVFFNGNKDMIATLIGECVRLVCKDPDEISGRFFSCKIYDVIMGMILIQTECFLRKKKIDEFMYAKEFVMLAHFGKNFLDKKYDQLLCECIRLGEMSLQHIDWQMMKESIECLRDEKEEYRHCIFYNMLEILEK